MSKYARLCRAAGIELVVLYKLNNVFLNEAICHSKIIIYLENKNNFSIADKVLIIIT